MSLELFFPLQLTVQQFRWKKKHKLKEPKFLSGHEYTSVKIQKLVIYFYLVNGRDTADNGKIEKLGKEQC